MSTAFIFLSQMLKSLFLFVSMYLREQQMNPKRAYIKIHRTSVALHNSCLKLSYFAKSLSCNYCCTVMVLQSFLEFFFLMLIIEGNFLLKSIENLDKMFEFNKKSFADCNGL